MGPYPLGYMIDKGSSPVYNRRDRGELRPGLSAPLVGASHGETTMNLEVIHARRKFQMDFGRLLTPELSIVFGQRWSEALEKDPEGSQCLLVIEDFREILTPMQK